MSNRALAVIAHHDDEIGCGGTLAKHAAAGDAVMVAVLSEGSASRGMRDMNRRREFINALRILGGGTVLENCEAAYPDNQMDTVPLLSVVRDIEDVVRCFQPDTVYTHWSGDLNVDHRVVSQAVDVACRPQPGCPVKRLLQFEVPCSTAWAAGFVPNWYVNIDPTLLEMKQRAFRCYPSEVREWPHPRSGFGISVLASMRGMAVGVETAEAFVLKRGVA